MFMSKWGIALISMMGLLMASAEVDINQADQQQLQVLQGIGPSRAQAIIDYRNRHGAFQSVDDLSAISGIGKATVDKLRAQAVAGAPSLPPVEASKAPQAIPQSRKNDL